MNNKELSKDLKAKAIKLGLCSKWQKDWTTEDKDALCEMYIEGIDFCIEHNYPTPKYMKDNFDGVMQRHGIYVDDDIYINNPKLRTYTINGNSKGVVSLDNFDLCEVYVRHNSDITINVKGQSAVFISVFEDAKVKVINNSILAKAKVYVYSKNARVGMIGDNIDIKESKLK